MLSHFSCVWLFATPWTVAHQTPLSLGFSRQEYWSQFPFPSAGDPNPGIELMSLTSPVLQEGPLPLASPGKPETRLHCSNNQFKFQWLNTTKVYFSLCSASWAGHQGILLSTGETPLNTGIYNLFPKKKKTAESHNGDRVQNFLLKATPDTLIVLNFQSRAHGHMRQRNAVLPCVREENWAVCAWSPWGD